MMRITVAVKKFRGVKPTPELWCIYFGEISALISAFIYPCLLGTVSSLAMIFASILLLSFNPINAGWFLSHAVFAWLSAISSPFQYRFGAIARPLPLVLFAVGFVFFIACFNPENEIVDIFFIPSSSTQSENYSGNLCHCCACAPFPLRYLYHIMGVTQHQALFYILTLFSERDGAMAARLMDGKKKNIMTDYVCIGAITL